MAGSEIGSSEAQQPLNLDLKTNKTIPRRKVTLIIITVLLNTLAWSALISLIASIVQIASDPTDTTSIAPVVLTSTSVCVHTFCSTKHHKLRILDSNNICICFPSHVFLLQAEDMGTTTANHVGC